VEFADKRIIALFKTDRGVYQQAAFRPSSEGLKAGVFAHKSGVFAHNDLIYVNRMGFFQGFSEEFIVGRKNRRTFASSKGNNDIFNRNKC
jgi:hypothetical protein